MILVCGKHQVNPEVKWFKYLYLEKFNKYKKKKKNDWYLGPADIKLKRNEVGNIKTNHDNMPVQFLNV